jgi:hypothetical protein
VNHAPRSPRARSALAETVRDLLVPVTGPMTVAATVFLPVRRVDEALRDGVRLPAGLGAPLADAFQIRVDGPRGARARSGLERVRPGGVATWSDEAVGE